MESGDVETKDTANVPSYTAVQLLFLVRLSDLVKMQAETDPALTVEEWRVALLRKAIYSTYCDCVQQGVAEDARMLFASKG